MIETTPKFTYEWKDVLVRLDFVGLTIGTKPILKGVNATVRDVVRPDMKQGQIVGILGPSGVGKSCLTRILSGLQEPTTGTVTVGTNNKVLAGKVGMVFQNYPLFRHKTVYSNLLVAANQKGLYGGDAAEAVLKLLASFGLTGHKDAWPSELSGGQRQRVSIAQQLLCSDHYLVLDEPFTGLDPAMKDRVCDLIRQISLLDEENTIFVVAHDIEAVISIADTLWVMGKEYDPTSNAWPGRIVRFYDLIERGIAWNPDARDTKVFRDVVREVRTCFDLAHAVD